MIEVVNKNDIRTNHACEQYKRSPVVSLIEYSPLLCGDRKFGKLNRRTAVRPRTLDQMRQLERRPCRPFSDPKHEFEPDGLTPDARIEFCSQRVSGRDLWPKSASKEG